MVVNVDTEEKIVIPTSELYKYIPVPLAEEILTDLSKGSSSSQSSNAIYTDKLRSRSINRSIGQRSCYFSVEDLESENKSNSCKDSQEGGTKLHDNITGKQDMIYTSRRNLPKDRSSSREKKYLICHK